MNSLRPDAERLVDLSDDDGSLPDTTTNDTDSTWGERPYDDWLREERPPHWDWHWTDTPARHD